ncbi:MAG: hypothetical protein QXU54_03140 [Candidatus Micrarchaeia archaeon]
MRKAGIIPALALAALISCQTAAPVQEQRKVEFKDLVRHENIIQSEAAATTSPYDIQKRCEGIYFSDKGEYYYYYNNKLWSLGSDEIFRNIDPDHIIAKFAWFGPHVYGVMSGGHHVLYINVAKNIREAINIEKKLKQAGNTRIILPHIAATERGAYLIASDLSAAFYLKPTAETIAIHMINLRRFLFGGEQRLFMPQINRLLPHFSAVEVDARNTKCILILDGESAMCKSPFLDPLFTLPDTE